jgi:glucosylglycerate synthase
MAETDVIDEAPRPAIGPELTADLLIAIPTFNNEETIATVLKAAQTALLHFPKWKAVIAHVDGGSSDSTMQRAKTSFEGETRFTQKLYPVFPVHRLEVSHHPLLGKESAYRTIFLMAEALNAKACCIVGGDIAVTPDWIASLVQPVLEMDFDLAAPLYQRQKYEGLLVSSLLYPLVRALFGKRITQPIGSDAAYSRTLVRRCLSLQTWSTESARRDIALWINIQAMQYDLKLCQVRLGRRPRSAKHVPQDVSSIMTNLVGALYFEIEQTAELWQRIRTSSAVPIFGLRFDPQANETTPDTNRMIDTFRIGCENLQDIWKLVLSPAALLDIRRMSRQPGDEFRFSSNLWARTVYDFAVAHRLRPIGRDHLLRALTPLYMGWIASFILSVRESEAAQVEEKIEELCMAYESEKPYLISRWRWPDRFMP